MPVSPAGWVTAQEPVLIDRLSHCTSLVTKTGRCEYVSVPPEHYSIATLRAGVLS